MTSPPGGGHIYRDIQIRNNTAPVYLGNIGEEIHRPEARRNELVAALFKGTRDSQEYREDLLILKGGRAPGTSNWVWGHPKVQMWRDGVIALLWMCGPPGIGKTFLSSYIAERLETCKCQDLQHSQSTVSLLLDFHFNNRDTAQSTVVAMLKSLVQSAIKQVPELKKLLFEAFENTSEPVAELSRFANLWSIFRNMLKHQSISRVYIIIDALDECDTTYKSELLGRLNNMTKTSLGNDGIRRISVLVSSREYPPSALDSVVQMRLNQEEENEDVTTNVVADVQRFIRSRIKERYSSSAYSEELRVELVSEFESRSQESFLWVSYAMDILQYFTPTEVREELHRLPPGLENMYHLMLSRIPDRCQGRALSILSWTSVAIRPLRLIELFAAVKPNQPLQGSAEQQAQQQCQYEQEVKDWIASCGHVLAVQGDTVVFVHTSARDYILQGGHDTKYSMGLFQLKEQDLQFRIARSCLAYMQNGALPTELAHAWYGNAGCDDGEPPASSLQQEYHKAARERYCQFPLLDYCVRYWPDHARLAPREVFDLSDQFFGDKSDSRISWLVEFEYCYNRKKEWMLDVGEANLVHLAARIGSPLLMLELKELSLQQPERIIFPDPITMRGNTPLMCASKYGHLDVARVLLASGADVNAQNFADLTSILLAAYYGRNDMVDFLFKNGAHLGMYGEGLSNSYCWSQKIVAAYRKLIQRLVISQNVDAVDLVRTRHGKIRLLLLSQEKDYDLLSLLLQAGANPNEIDASGNTPLMHAVWTANVAAVALLLKHDAKVDMRNYSGQTALISACSLMPSYNRDRCIDILLDHGASLEERDPGGNTPLLKAIYHSYWGNVRLLVNKGAAANTTCIDGRLPLEVSLCNSRQASPYHRLEISLLLLEHTDLSLLETERKESILRRIRYLKESSRLTGGI